MQHQTYALNERLSSNHRSRLVPGFIHRMLYPEDFPEMREKSLALLLFVYGTMVFFIHGLHKAVDVFVYLQTGASSKFLEEVAAMGVPAPIFMAAFAALVQLVSGLRIAVGLLTRPAGIALTCALAGAIAQNLTAGRDPQLAILYTLIAATFALAGGGPYALDATLWKCMSSPLNPPGVLS